MMVTLLILLAATPTIASSKGSVKIDVSSTMFVGGNEIKPGQYDIEWDYSSPETTVTFSTKGTVAARVQGKIMKSDRKYDFTSLKSGKDSSGRVVIKELQFSGKNIKIVFE